MNRTLIDYEFRQKDEKKSRFRMSWRWLRALLVICFLLTGGFFVWKIFGKTQSTLVENQAPQEQETEENVFSYIVSEGDIPAEVFEREGKFDANDVGALLAASANIYDFTNIKIGQKLDFIFPDGKEKAQKIRYYQNTESVIVAETNGDNDFHVRKESIPYEVKEETAEVKIDEFLYKDALDAGLTEATVLEVADIFSFDIDFTTEIKEGDELKVIFEKRTLDGKEAPDGRVLAAKFVNNGQEYFAYHFESEEEGSHYDSEGKELLRQFLRAPLSYRRISSGFSGARFHPITKTISAHYQIDYAAPSGTPVVATARGTVASAGWEGGWGRIVRLRHDNGYTTHYAHLSGYAKGIKSGASVSQGQVIGYVGSTGWSTGPHLDYGMRLGGSPINPLSLKLPKGEPLQGGELEKFQEVKKKYEGL